MWPGPVPDGGWRVVEICESEAAAHKYDEEQVEPVLSRVGIKRPAPQTSQVHNLLVRGA